jgi:hypothetical protein
MMSTALAVRRVSLFPTPHGHTTLFRGRGYEIAGVVCLAAAIFWRVPLLILALAALGVWLIVSGVIHVRSRAKCRGYAATPGDGRLLCYGNPEELRSLEQLEDIMFDPVIVQTSPFEQSPAKRVPVGALSLALLLIALLVLDFTPPVSLSIGLGFLAAWQLVYYLGYPLYYRVSPGILEVLEYELIPRRPPTRTVVPLDSARICCRYDERRLTIEPESEELPAVTISLERLPQATRFVRAVFQSAVSSHRGPLLPTDELLG